MEIGENMIDLSVIIVDYNSSELTVASVESILENRGDCQLEIIIVDNSPFKTIALLELSKKNKLIKYHHSSTNLGYGRANNIGINNSKGEFILIINPDINIIQGKLNLLVNHARKIKKLGALSCKLINSDGTFQESRSYNVGSVYSRLQSNIIFSKLIKNKKWLLPPSNKIEALMGSFLLFPKEVIIKTGAFDPDFFMYSEEIELCLRIAKNNYQLCYYEEMTVTHLNGGTIKDNKWQFNQKLLSDFLFYKKSFGLKGYLLHHFLFVTNIISNYLFYYFLSTEMRQYTQSSMIGYFTQFKKIIQIPFLSTDSNYCNIQPFKSKV